MRGPKGGQGGPMVGQGGQQSFCCAMTQNYAHPRLKIAIAVSIKGYSLVVVPLTKFKLVP